MSMMKAEAADLFWKHYCMLHKITNAQRAEDLRSPMIQAFKAGIIWQEFEYAKRANSERLLKGDSNEQAG